MKPNTITNQSVQYQVWKDAQCEEVMNAAFQILERTGCHVRNEKARRLLEEKGCTVEEEWVYIPQGLMKWAVERAPSVVTLYDRMGNPAMKLSPNRVHFGPVITCTQIVDYKTGEKRPGTKKDVEDVIRLMGALPNISWASAMCSISDVAEELADVYEVYLLLKNSKKPFMFWAHSTKNLKMELSLMEIAAGGMDALRQKPFCMNLICPTDPLIHTQDGMEQLMLMAEMGLPTVYIAGIGFGLSGPITLAGGIALGLADTLVGLLVSQLVNPGVPFIVSKFNDNIDMRTVTMAHSRPELVVAQCATADLFRYMKLPFCSNFGNTDSGVFDEISVFDKTVQLYSCFLSGTNMSFAIGAYEAGNLSRLEDFVLCNEIIEFTKTLVGGVEITEETLAEEVIHEVGPGGNFISEEHTIAHIHEFYTPDLLEPIKFMDREKNGVTLQGRIRARIDDLLSRPFVSPLSKEEMAALDKMMDQLVQDLER